MTNNLPNLVIKHRRIDTPKSTRWNLTPCIYEGGTNINIQRANHLDEVARLPIKSNLFICMVENWKAHAEGLLDSGASVREVRNNIGSLKAFVSFADTKRERLDTVDNIRKALFKYSEHLFTRTALTQITASTAYYGVARCVGFLNSTLEDLQFSMNQTRLKPKAKSRRALGRGVEKIKLNEASELANFCFELAQSFKPSTLTSGSLPILVNVGCLQVNLTSAGGRKKQETIGKNFTQTQAYQAFNTRVSAEIMIFLAMTIQNQAPTYQIKRYKFDYKPLGEKYEVREFKARRGGEVLFKIPKPYKPYFERYIDFLDEYAPDSEWLFPYLEKGKGFRKTTDDDTSKLRRLCLRYQVPWVPPSSFRSIGVNLLMRMASDEKTSADYAGHAVATFRQSYEFPSLQRAMIQISRFWDENDPLTHGNPTVSLFNAPCNGVPMPVEDATKNLPKPDCINPTGCIGCLNFRDDDSFDYVWNLHSFRYLEIIASSSHRTKETKTANIAIDWANLKINWFKTSKNKKRKEWVDEAQMRIEEGEYHPNWSRKIQKFEG